MLGLRNVLVEVGTSWIDYYKLKRLRGSTHCRYPTVVVDVTSVTLLVDREHVRSFP